MLYPAKEFIFVSIFFINSVKTADICYKSNWNNYIVGKKLSEFPIKIFDKIGPQSCYRECQAHGNCFSANYDKNESTCQLMNTKKSEMKLLIDDENFIHIELTDTVSTVINKIIKSVTSKLKKKSLYIYATLHIINVSSGGGAVI